MLIEIEIEQLVNQYLKDFPELFLIDVKVKIGNKICIRIDSDNSITVQDCRGLSRFIESNLDREKEDFELEVSSAGIEFPLINHRQYLKNMGRNVQVQTTEGTIYKGKLLAVTQSEIGLAAEINLKNKKISIENTTLSLDKVKEIKVIISFM